MQIENLETYWHKARDKKNYSKIALVLKQKISKIKGLKRKHFNSHWGSLEKPLTNSKRY